MAESRTVVLKNSTWYRGHRSATSQLLRADGMMCCLGFDAISSGLRPDQIIDCLLPHNVKQENDTQEYRRRWARIVAPSAPIQKALGLVPGELGMQAENLAAWINDREGLTDEERLALLRPLFEEVGVRLEFDPDS